MAFNFEKINATLDAIAKAEYTNYDVKPASKMRMAELTVLEKSGKNIVLRFNNETETLAKLDNDTTTTYSKVKQVPEFNEDTHYSIYTNNFKSSTIKLILTKYTRYYDSLCNKITIEDLQIGDIIYAEWSIPIVSLHNDHYSFTQFLNKVVVCN